MSKYATVPADSDPMTYLDANVDPGVGYRYRVKAVNDAGEGGISHWLDIFVNSPATGAAGHRRRGPGGPDADGGHLGHRRRQRPRRRDVQLPVAPRQPADCGRHGSRPTPSPKTTWTAPSGCGVSFTDDHGFEETLTSEPTAAVAPPNRAATGRPTISGALVVGQTLTANTSGIADEDGMGNAAFSYQWIRSDGTADTHIADATGVAYTLVSDDEGRTINVKVSFNRQR